MSKDNMIIDHNNKAEYYLQNAKICRLVQANPCMYDRSSPNYLKKKYMDRAWAQISREVNDTIVSCKERWRNIRTAYARSVNIYKTPCGPNRHKRYYLHDELQFLTKHIAPGLPSLPFRILTPTELEENHENSRQSIEETDENCTFQITIDSSSTPPPPTVPEEKPNQQRISTPEYDYTETPPPAKKSRRIISASSEMPKEVVSVPRRRDLDSEFLQSLTPEMKAMNSRQKILFKAKIYQVLEEVFSDSKDFPSKIDLSTTKTNFLSPDSPEKSPASRNIGTEVVRLGDQREKQPEASPQSFRIDMVPLEQSQIESTFVKQETINVEEDD